MPCLREQKAFRQILGLPFCYVCGKTFVTGERRTRDHVPAKACFAVADRSHPLLLSAHEGCNSSNKLVDEKIGQLIGLRHGAVPEQSKRRLHVRAMKDSDGGMMGGVNNLDIPGAVRRWISAFHAALYSEPLPPQTKHAMETPFQTATMKDGQIAFQPLREQHRLLIEVLKRQRAADNLDRIHCNNGKLIYECVWDRPDDGGWLCVYGLDVYGWADLGDTKRFQRRGCAGFYVLPERRVPTAATKAAEFRILLPTSEPFDPFGN